MQKRKLGIIGGSGVYSVDELNNVEERIVDTPWGAPSGPLVSGTLNGVEVVFLARHGAGHRMTPSSVNYRANIDALKRCGVTDVISVSACGSLREEFAPGEFVIVDQFIDRTSRREKSFFGDGCVAHVSMAKPVCPALAVALSAACDAEEIAYHQDATYICIDGPQFSSRAESNLYRQWKADIIGMTNMPEAKLAREAELPYATIGMVTDYDCWRDASGHVEVADILSIMAANTAKARRLIARLTLVLGATREPSPLGIETCLDFAMITAPEARAPELLAKLDVIAGRYLKAAENSKSA